MQTDVIPLGTVCSHDGCDDPAISTYRVGKGEIRGYYCTWHRQVVEAVRSDLSNFIETPAKPATPTLSLEQMNDEQLEIELLKLLLVNEKQYHVLVDTFVNHRHPERLDPINQRIRRILLNLTKDQRK